MPFVEVKPLVQSDNRWKPADSAKVDELEKLLRTTKGLLNKFTPEKMAKLTDQFLDLEINSRSDMVAVIDLVFDKALFEPIFGYMYSELCAKCAEKFPEFKDENNPDAKPQTFKRLLLNKCQEEFEKENRIDEVLAELPEDATPEDREIVRKRVKGRMLGNIRFIGELYKQKMLTEKIMHECLIKLLGEVQNPDEDEIECLCKLLTTIGKLIDHAKAKPHMDQYFSRMSEMSQNMNLPNRMRFMLQEVIDLRRGQWSHRKPDPSGTKDNSDRGKGGRIAQGSGDIRKEMGTNRGATKGGAAAGGRGGRAAGDDGFTAVGGKGGKGPKADANHSKGGEPSAAAPPPQKKLSKEELGEKIEGNLDEYFSGAGLDELVQCTRDLQPKADAPDELGVQAVQAAMTKGFDARSNEQRVKCAKVLGALYQAKLLKSAQVTTLFNEALEFIEDDLCDIPHIATYMAEFIAAAVHDGAIKLSFINEAFAHLVESETVPAIQMACGVLTALRPLVDDDAKLRQMYTAEVQLGKCVPPDSNNPVALAQLLEAKGLSFVDPKLGAEVAKARDEEQLAALRAYLAANLGDADGVGGKSDEEIIGWMSENASGSTASQAAARLALRALLDLTPMEYVMEEAKPAQHKLTKSIERRQTLLKRLLGQGGAEQTKRQANCLFEVQKFCHDANWPQGTCKVIFYKLYDCDIVFEEAINFWREDTSDETPGKMKALVHVNEFLTWLETAQEDGEGEGEDDGDDE